MACLGTECPIDPPIDWGADVLQRVTVSEPGDLDWLPAEGTHLSYRELVQIFVALRALIDGTDRLEPNRSHAFTIGRVLTRAIGRQEGE